MNSYIFPYYSSIYIYIICGLTAPFYIYFSRCHIIMSSHCYVHCDDLCAHMCVCMCVYVCICMDPYKCTPGTPLMSQIAAPNIALACTKLTWSCLDEHRPLWCIIKSLHKSYEVICYQDCTLKVILSTSNKWFRNKHVGWWVAIVYW